MASITKEQLFSQSGYPLQGLRNALLAFGCKTLEELQAGVAEGDVYLNQLLRVRGNGSIYAPGILAQYLFGVQSREEMIQEKIQSNLGDGI